MSNKYYLGKLCRRNHDYENTGKSLRYTKGGACILCIYGKLPIDMNLDINFTVDNYEYWKNLNLIRKYGISLEDYKEMHNKQNGLCAICGQPETKIRNGRLFDLVVDHDHTTGKVRGLLCDKCNRFLWTIDNDDYLKLALAYLQK